ncbi:MAG: nucleoside hydrolase [Rugosibacter sp.]|nr:nucleoside hydrolase [Rugosibacter sp.]
MVEVSARLLRIGAFLAIVSPLTKQRNTTMLRNRLKRSVLPLAWFALVAWGQVVHAQERYVIIDDDIGLNAKGCLAKGYLRSYKIAIPDLEPKWNPIIELGRACDGDGSVELVYALYKAQMDPHLHIVGVTTMHGVMAPEYTYQSAKNILDRLGSQLKEPVPVFMGAPDWADSFGKRTPAVDFIIRTVMANPGKVEILATGPLTNIATAVMLEPRLPKMWKQLYVGGTGNFNDELIKGYQYLGYSAHVPEMNANGDVRAMQYLVDRQENTTWFSGEASEWHPWGICANDWLSIWLPNMLKRNFQNYWATENAAWMLMVNTIGRTVSWKTGCALDSGSSEIALMLYPQLRGDYVVSGVGVIRNPGQTDGSYSQTLSQDPSKPQVPIYYTIKGDWTQVKNEVMKALLYFH